MKLNTTLSGIAALLLVAVFYTFAFMVEDVDEKAISMEYYYSTETEAVTEAEDTETDFGADNSQNDEFIVIPPMNDVVEAVPALPENIVEEKNEDENIPVEPEKNEEPVVTTAAQGSGRRKKQLPRRF